MEKKNGTARSTGLDGEKLAEEYLKNKDFRVLERNYRHKRAEIDLIVRRNDLIVFVEVKTRKNKAFGNPEEFVSDLQAARIMEASESYLEKIEWQYQVRFDIVAITLKPKLEITHFEDGIF